jgi:hypothetical protein
MLGKDLNTMVIGISNINIPRGIHSNIMGSVKVESAVLIEPNSASNVPVFVNF